MKPFEANFINGLSLSAMSAWEFFENGYTSALLPLALGVFFWARTNAMKNPNNRIVAHTVVIFTFIILICLIKPFVNFMRNDEVLSGIRTLIMIATCTFAMIVYVQSFMDARKIRLAAQEPVV